MPDDVPEDYTLSRFERDVNDEAGSGIGKCLQSIFPYLI